MPVLPTAPANPDCLGKQAREAHVRALTEIRRAATAERDSRVSRVRHELESLRRHARRSVRKERKRSRAYKAQAIEAHKRGLRARHVLQARASAIEAAAAAATATAVGGGGFAGRGAPAGEAMRRRVAMDSGPSSFGTVRGLVVCMRACVRTSRGDGWDLAPNTDNIAQTLLLIVLFQPT